MIRARFLPPAALLAAALTGLLLAQDDPGYRPGVTVYVYEIGDAVNGFPRIDDGQTPNVAYDRDDAALEGPWPTLPTLTENFAGHVWGELLVPSAGRYAFRVRGTDGARLLLDGVVIAETTDGASALGRVDLEAGPVPLRLEFVHQSGPFRLRFDWRPPGAARYLPVPADVLRTEVGQTHVVSPGRKRWTLPGSEGGSAGGPGDGRPLTGVHPSFTLEAIRPEGFEPAVGGMAFLPDGRLAVCTWDREGAVYILDHLDDDAPVTATRFAAGLGEPLGIAVVDGTIYVAQKMEVTRLRDADFDGTADLYEAIASGWPGSSNYHEFTFNLVAHDGALWTTTSVPLRGGHTLYLRGAAGGEFPVPGGPGCLIRIDPDARTWRIAARGLRTPNGLGVGPDDALYCFDNQGSWLPASRLNRMREGGFYGHQETAEGNEVADPPVLWLPHGAIGNSPSQPVVVPEGPYAGQILFGDVTHGGIKRAFLEEVNGVMQGCAFRFTQGLEAGVNRLEWGPDGALYVGGIGSNGNWHHRNTTFGLERLVPNGRPTFEMLRVEARVDGLLITFTKPVSDAAGDPAAYDVRHFRYDATIDYGGPRLDETDLPVRAALVSPDRTQVFVSLPDLADDRVVAIRLQDVTSLDGQAPWSTEAWYTLNRRPVEAGPGFVPRPVAARPTPVRYEAEDARVIGATIRRDHPGATGNGFVDFTQDDDDAVTFEIPSDQGETVTLSVRYANGDTDRPLAVLLNGNIAQAALSFPATGGWSNWDTVPLTIDLTPGVNDVTLLAIGSSGPNIDHLARNDESGMVPPPPGARPLAAGAWRRGINRDPVPPRRDDTLRIEPERIAGGETWGSGSLFLRRNHGDVMLHAEWKLPARADGADAPANSGIKFLERYEVQILDTPIDAAPTVTDAGAIYGLRAPDVNAGRGPGRWQTYDIWFRAPRWAGRTKIEDARMTVYWNGVLVQDDVVVPAQTGASPPEASGRWSLELQDHGARVAFRNLWLLEPPVFERGERTIVAGPDPVDFSGPITSGGDVQRFIVIPPLPPGLFLDPDTGAIGGIATGRPSATEHVLYAWNAAGAAQTELHVVVEGR